MEFRIVLIWDRVKGAQIEWFLTLDGLGLVSRHLYRLIEFIPIVCGLFLSNWFVHWIYFCRCRYYEIQSRLQPSSELPISRRRSLDNQVLKYIWIFKCGLWFNHYFSPKMQGIELNFFRNDWTYFFLSFECLTMDFMLLTSIIYVNILSRSWKIKNSLSNS